MIVDLRCTACEHTVAYDKTADDGPCSKCGGIYEVRFDYDHAGRKLRLHDAPQDIRRYLPLLPVDAKAQLTPLVVGGTPSIACPQLAKELGVAEAFIKDDGRNPTGSLKDRASFIAVARASAKGAKVVAAASTGNAATSLAGLAASMGLEAHIFVPASAPVAKRAQLAIYGAKVFAVDASYDVTYDLCQEAVAEFGWYDRSAAVNPYLVEGKKTCGLEIAEQLRGNIPDWVAMSVGDGCSIAGAYKGLWEMKQLGITDKVPRMLGVQSKKARAVVAAFEAGASTVASMPAESLADSINVGTPRNPIKALTSVRKSDGAYVDVEDEAILHWMAVSGRTTGIFGEPAAVTAIAGVHEARQRGIIAAGESVLCVSSGTGLKDVDRARQAAVLSEPIAPNLEAVRQMLQA